jgi:hypothetical protein
VTPVPTVVVARKKVKKERRPSHAQTTTTKATRRPKIVPTAELSRPSPQLAPTTTSSMITRHLGFKVGLLATKRETSVFLNKLRCLTSVVVLLESDHCCVARAENFRSGLATDKSVLSSPIDHAKSRRCKFVQQLSSRVQCIHVSKTWRLPSSIPSTCISSVVPRSVHYTLTPRWIFHAAKSSASESSCIRSASLSTALLRMCSANRVPWN